MYCRPVHQGGQGQVQAPTTLTAFCAGAGPPTESVLLERSTWSPVAANVHEQSAVSPFNNRRFSEAEAGGEYACSGLRSGERAEWRS